MGLTNRGVIWLGQTCNLRCKFCYFLNSITDKKHPEHAFMNLEKAKRIVWNLRYAYGNRFVDIQGGEPLIYKHIYDLVGFCYYINLKPTLITNGVRLAELNVVEKLKEAHINDLLISVHALGDTYDEIVKMKGASKKQLKGIQNCKKYDIPFRFNTVLTKWAMPQYMDIARLAVDSGAKVHNFIAFNPFADQSGNRNVEDVATYTEIMYYLTPVLDYLDSSGVAVNIRYIPFCVVESRHQHHVYNFPNLPYDEHEWDYNSWVWSDLKPQRSAPGALTQLTLLKDRTNGNGFWSRLSILKKPNKKYYQKDAELRAQQHCKYKYAEECNRCKLKIVKCDGFHGDYAEFFGVEEVSPIG